MAKLWFSVAADSSALTRTYCLDLRLESQKSNYPCCTKHHLLDLRHRYISNIRHTCFDGGVELIPDIALGAGSKCAPERLKSHMAPVGLPGLHRSFEPDTSCSSVLSIQLTAIGYPNAEPVSSDCDFLHGSLHTSVKGPIVLRELVMESWTKQQGEMRPICFTNANTALQQQLKLAESES